MKRIIGLCGISHTGKATTLKLLLKFFDPTFMSSSRRNFRKALTFKGGKICIATCGDNPNDLEGNCSFFQQEDFDIAITPTRSKGKSCERLARMAREESTRIQWIEKKKDYLNPDSCNYEQAVMLHDLIVNLIDNAEVNHVN